MQIVMSVDFGHDDQLIFAQQLGVNNVLVRINQSWNHEIIEQVKNRVKQCGLVLVGLEGFDPKHECADNSVIAAGETGVTLLSTFMKENNKNIQRPIGRGNALVSTIKDEIYEDPIESVSHLAKKNNVKIAWTYPYVSNKPSTGIDLQITEWSKMQERQLAQTKAPVYIARVGNRIGKNQAFLDDGEISLPQTLRKLQSVGFSGYIATTPPPGLIDDTDWRHKGRSHDVGYLKAIIQTLESCQGH